MTVHPNNKYTPEELKKRVSVPKNPWEMSLLELVEYSGDNDVIPEHRLNYYLWLALAKDIEEIKSKLNKL